MKIIYILALAFLQLLYALPTGKSKEIELISKQYLGDPYVWGGNSPKTGMDCSGYTKYVFNKVGIKIPRTAYAQSKKGIPVKMKDLKKGDLLFFLTDKTRNIPITHVGIYLGHHKFIHAASTKEGIIISRLNGTYQKKFVMAKRYIINQSLSSKHFYIALDNEIMKSTMKPEITRFGGTNETF